MRALVGRSSGGFTLGLGTGTFGKLKEFMNTLDIPDNAVLHVTEDYDGYPDELCFSYSSLETDEEYEARLKKEHYEQRRLEDDEKTMYKILKAKFEGDN